MISLFKIFILPVVAFVLGFAACLFGWGLHYKGKVLPRGEYFLLGDRYLFGADDSSDRTVGVFGRSSFLIFQLREEFERMQYIGAEDMSVSVKRQYKSGNLHICLSSMDGENKEHLLFKNGKMVPDLRISVKDGNLSKIFKLEVKEVEVPLADAAANARFDDYVNDLEQAVDDSFLKSYLTKYGQKTK